MGYQGEYRFFTESWKQIKTAEYGEQREMLSVLTGKISYLQPAIKMDAELREVQAHPALQQMLKYSFVGDPDSIKQQTLEFLELTGVDELMVVGNIYDHQDRVRSFELFSEVMKSINS